MTAVAPSLTPTMMWTQFDVVRCGPMPSGPRRPEPKRLLAGSAPARSGRPRRAVYWRRRLAATVIGATTLLGLATGAGAVFGGAAAGPARGPVVTRYTVQPGDTLWRIARRLEPRHDPREVVDLLAEARHTTFVVPGEVIDWAGM